MAFVPVPDTAQFEIVYSWDGQIVENVLHYRILAGPITETALQDWTETLAAFVKDTLLPLAADTLTLLRVVAKAIDVLDGIFYVATTGLPAVGGGGSAALPNSVTAAYSWRTGLAGRSFRGRSFIPGLQEGQVTANALTPAAVTAYTNAWEQLRTVGGSEGWEMVVVSTVSGGAPRVTGIATPVTSSFFADNTVDSQRRRLPGRGA